MKKIALKNAARGTAFDYAGQSWILLENDDGRALCLSKDIIETRAFDEGNCNNFAVASSKEYLNGAYLDNLLEDVNGPNAFLTTELDLTTDDGLKDYGTCTVTIFLLTVDQYRRNRDVIPNADDWWWLSTAFSTKSNGYESLARSVNADGTLSWNLACIGGNGLRPACYLDSDLLISIEDDEATDDVTPEHAGEIIAALAEQFGGTFDLRRDDWELGKRFEHTAEQEAETPESTNQTTDLSDAPEEIKEQIIENDRALKERDAPEPATLPEGFDVVDQLAELLAERKKLHIIDEENLRYNCDIIALEYAIGALRR